MCWDKSLNHNIEPRLWDDWLYYNQILLLFRLLSLYNLVVLLSVSPLYQCSLVPVEQKGQGEPLVIPKFLKVNTSEATISKKLLRSMTQDEPGRTRTTQDDPGQLRTTQDDPERPRTTQDDPGQPKMTQVT